MAKYIFDDTNNSTRAAHKIKYEYTIDDIRRCGFFGKNPQIGDYAIYLGPSDGGYLVVSAEDKNLVKD